MTPSRRLALEILAAAAVVALVAVSGYLFTGTPLPRLF
ncbi:hypothetical protein [Caulobacter phage S2B]|uniref:Uncharacterized protein n=1 Tax=Caulobacter phage S2B TaxID=2759120 RepID=A0AAE7ML73_9CAUD|nr:hypothetical protein [Caulobacter phage S2B]